MRADTGAVKLILLQLDIVHESESVSTLRLKKRGEAVNNLFFTMLMCVLAFLTVGFAESLATKQTQTNPWFAKTPRSCRWVVTILVLAMVFVILQQLPKHCCSNSGLYLW
jgi:hypothetical protein